MMAGRRIAIIGGGPGGLMLAKLLSLRGIEATVFERDRHAGERPQGGSLDLHADTGLRAMRLAGLEDEFWAAARPEDQGDRLYDQNGVLLFDRDGMGDGRPEIDRAVLRQILLGSLPGGIVRWGSKVDAILPVEGDGYQVFVGETQERFDMVVGADGAWSRVRPLLTDALPLYEGVTFVEFGFDADRHPHVETLVGSGKMFAVGDNRGLVVQRNGRGHLRGYAILRLPEETSQEMTSMAPGRVRAMLVEAFAGWAPSLIDLIECGDFIAVRSLYALPIGMRWQSRAGATLLGDAAHLMSPFGGEGVNLALADANDLADALASTKSWRAVVDYEKAMVGRAIPAAQGAAAGLNGAISAHGVAIVLEHYRERGAI